MIEITEILSRRNAVGATQVELSRASGVAQSIISSLESGVRDNPTLKVIKAIEAGLAKLEAEHARRQQGGQDSAAA